MWVLDGGTDSLFSYDLATGETLGVYSLDPANNDPHGLWSDGYVILISERGSAGLFAYQVQGDDLVRLPDEEFRVRSGDGRRVVSGPTEA